jgi:hypothetical protein
MVASIIHVVRALIVLASPHRDLVLENLSAAAAARYLPAHRGEARHALVRSAVLARTSTGMA